MKLIFSLAVINLLNINALLCQKEANKWYFERFNGLDFNGDTLRYLNNCPFGQTESSSNICDSMGNIWFSTNGTYIWNRYNRIINNFSKLNYESGINNTSNHGAIILKHVENPYIYVICSDFQARSHGIFYSIVDPKGNLDSGTIIKNRIPLLPQPINEPISVVNHKNGKDYWIAVHGYGSKMFHLFLLTKNGIIPCSVDSDTGVLHSGLSESHAQVSLKFSPDGNFICQDQLQWGNTEVLKFDNSTGVILNSHVINSLNRVYGYEFSPNSKFLYISQMDSGLIQMNLETKSKIKISGINANDYPIGLQLAPDGRIYAIYTDRRDLFVINRPDREGDSCLIEIKRNFFPNTALTSFPNFNQSYFYTPSVDFRYKMNCIDNSIEFEGLDTFKANSHKWILKRKNNTIEATYFTQNAIHAFSDTGVYEVEYIASTGIRSDTVIKSIAIFPKINRQFLGRDTFYGTGTNITKLLKAPLGMHCRFWQDSSGLTTYTADTAGIYYCKVTNSAFCEVTDTIVITECINNLDQPSLYRSGDTLFTYHISSDSFVWFRNGVQYAITKQAFIKLTDTGTYRVEVAKKGYCNRSSLPNWVNKLGLNEVNIRDLIKIYPNPSTGKVYIESELEFELIIFDISGRTLVKTENIKEITLLQGIYFFQFTQNGVKFISKVVIF